MKALIMINIIGMQMCESAYLEDPKKIKPKMITTAVVRMSPFNGNPN